VKPKIKINELTPEYVAREYGVTSKQLAAAEKRIKQEIAAERKAGKLEKFTGTLTLQRSRRKSANSKLKRPASTKRKKPLRDISADGQLEVRGKEIIIYEPLVGEIEQHCKRRKISWRQFWDELFSGIREKTKSAKVKKPKTTRAKLTMK
jgi:hypothetical protein